MTVHALGDRLAARVEIDACETCQAFWFDSSESPRLSPASTLKLFSLIAETLPRRSGSVARVLKCPRCRSRLLDTQDMQRNTRFSYSRCPQGQVLRAGSALLPLADGLSPVKARIALTLELMA